METEMYHLLHNVPAVLPLRQINPVELIVLVYYKVTPKFYPLGLPFIATCILEAHRSTRSNFCGPLPKMLDTPGLNVSNT
jgi:hypothetical protein